MIRIVFQIDSSQKENAAKLVFISDIFFRNGKFFYQHKISN